MGNHWRILRKGICDMIYILKITVEAVLRMYCKGAEGNREPCKKVIPVIHGYSGAGEK